MRRTATLPLIALAAALALAGCNQAAKTTDNAMVNADDAVEVNDSAFNDAAPLVEDAAEDTTAAVAVVAVPARPSGVPAAEVAPLDDAAAIEGEIRAGNGIRRIRYGEGWAWTRDGRIVRTADRDGQNPAYFRPGDDRPFFVQRGARAYAYDGERPVREFGRDGRVRAPDAERSREAADAWREARDRRDRAEHARDEADNSRPERPPQASPTPAPSPSPSPTADRPRRRGQGERPQWQATPTPEASPSPTSRWRQPRRSPGDRDPGDR